MSRLFPLPEFSWWQATLPTPFSAGYTMHMQPPGSTNRRQASNSQGDRRLGYPGFGTVVFDIWVCTCQWKFTIGAFIEEQFPKSRPNTICPVNLRIKFVPSRSPRTDGLDPCSA